MEANGGKIADSREELLKFAFGDGDSGNMWSRLANVTQPLGPASNVCEEEAARPSTARGRMRNSNAVGKISRCEGRTACTFWTRGSEVAS